MNQCVYARSYDSKTNKKMIPRVRYVMIAKSRSDFGSFFFYLFFFVYLLKIFYRKFMKFMPRIKSYYDWLRICVFFTLNLNFMIYLFLVFHFFSFKYHTGWLILIYFFSLNLLWFYTNFIKTTKIKTNEQTNKLNANNNRQIINIKINKNHLDKIEILYRICRKMGRGYFIYCWISFFFFFF